LKFRAFVDQVRDAAIAERDGSFSSELRRVRRA
jgi:hypothetical protein